MKKNEEKRTIQSSKLLHSPGRRRFILILLHQSLEFSRIWWKDAIQHDNRSWNVKLIVLKLAPLGMDSFIHTNNGEKTGRKRKQNRTRKIHFERFGGNHTLAGQKRNGNVIINLEDRRDLWRVRINKHGAGERYEKPWIDHVSPSIWIRYGEECEAFKSCWCWHLEALLPSLFTYANDNSSYTVTLFLTSGWGLNTRRYSLCCWTQHSFFFIFFLLFFCLFSFVIFYRIGSVNFTVSSMHQTFQTSTWPWGYLASTFPQ